MEWPRKLFEYKSLPDQYLETVQKDGKRFYDVDGNLYPSVTTVLSTLSKDGIMEWRKRIGEEEADRIMRKAANRGTKVHKLAEDYLLNKPDYKVGAMPNIVEMFNQLKPWLDDNVEYIYGNEIALYSHKIKSAGRCDLIAHVDGEPAIVDFKTSTKEKSADFIENYFMQVTAYAIMLFEMHNVVAKRAYILVTLEESNKLQVFKINIGDFLNKTILHFKNYHNS